MISHWFQILASIATALTAYFSWRAIKQAEEITFKPVIALKAAHYLNKKLTINILNLSKEGDKWAQDISIEIVGSNIKEVNEGYVGPGENCKIVIDNIEKEMWQSKILKVFYKSFNQKIYISEYLFAGAAIKESSIHQEATFVDLKRVK